VRTKPYNPVPELRPPYAPTPEQGFAGGGGGGGGSGGAGGAGAPGGGGGEEEEEWETDADE